MPRRNRVFRISRRKNCVPAEFQSSSENSNFRIILPKDIQVGFDEFIGQKEAKKELSSLIHFLEDPKKYENYGVTPHCKYLFIGPDGIGKAALACSVAKAVNLPIIVVEPSLFFNAEGVLEEIDELFYVIHLFLEKKQNCILLFKELQYLSALTPDASQPLLEKLLGHLRKLPELVAFATFSSSTYAELHKLLIEKPAFDRIVTLLPPELNTREEILKVLLKDVPTADDINIHRLALDTFNMTAGDIKKLVRDAILLALQNGQENVVYSNFSEALSQTEFGYANDGILNEAERLLTARHEAGHVIAGYFSSPDTYKVSKVEITPRSFYLGITQETANEEKRSFFKEDYEKKLITCFGGMASEYFYYKSTSSGVVADLEAATSLAISIHKLYGMSNEIGPICLLSGDYSFEILDKKADVLIQRYLKKMYIKTQEIIENHSDALDALTDALLQKEIIYSDEVMSILRNYTK